MSVARHILFSAIVALAGTLLTGCASTETNDVPTSRGPSAAEPRIESGDAQASTPIRGSAPVVPPSAAPAAWATTRPAHAGADAERPSDVPEDDDDSEPALFRRITEVFGREGEIKDGVYRLVTPRADLFVMMDGMDVPTGAFLESDFRFWRCPCGKLLVNGQFVVADYEANDVVDELHEGRLHVVTIAPLLLHEKPRLLLIRFQGEGTAREVAEALKSALSYTGEARHAPQPVDLSPRQ